MKEQTYTKVKAIKKFTMGIGDPIKVNTNDIVEVTEAVATNLIKKGVATKEVPSQEDKVSAKEMEEALTEVTKEAPEVETATLPKKETKKKKGKGSIEKRPIQK